MNYPTLLIPEVAPYGWVQTVENFTFPLELHSNDYNIFQNFLQFEIGIKKKSVWYFVQVGEVRLCIVLLQIICTNRQQSCNQTVKNTNNIISMFNSHMCFFKRPNPSDCLLNLLIVPSASKIFLSEFDSKSLY